MNSYTGFKKVSADKNFTTMKHENGSELKVAHAGLTPKLRHELSKLPIYAAGGTDEVEDSMADMPNATDAKSGNPIVINVGTPSQPQQTAPTIPMPQQPPQQQQEAQQQQRPSLWDAINNNLALTHPYDPNGATFKQATGYQGLLNQGTADSAQSRMPNASTAPAAETPATQNTKEEAPKAGSLAEEVKKDTAASSDKSLKSTYKSSTSLAPTYDPNSDFAQKKSPLAGTPEYDKAFNDYKVAHTQNMAKEDAAFQQDLMNGHIQPKTYGQWFNDQSTLGKIGTIFGLLASAPAMIAGKPGLMRSIIDNEINNDYNAQVASKKNAQEMIKLNQAHQLQQSEIYHNTQAGNLSGAQAKLANQDGLIKADAFYQLQRNRILFQNLADKVREMETANPNDPRLPAAKQTLGMASMAVDGLNANIIDVASGKLALNGVNGGNAALAASGPQGAAYVKYNESHKFAGIPGTASQEIEPKDRDRVAAVQNLLQKEQELRDWASKNSGSLNPAVTAEGQAKSRIVQDAYRQVNGEGVFRKGESEFIQGIIDSDPTKFFNAWRVDPKFKSAIHSAEGDLNSVLGKYNLNSASTKSAESDMVTVTSPSGQQGKMPKANLQKALKQGYKLVQ